MKHLLKGIEIELFAGKETGEVLPLSDKLKKRFPNFTQEPDKRNFEYRTTPTLSYETLLHEIIYPRIKVRNFLDDTGNLVLIPGSTISLPFDKKFYFSKENDPYYEFICKAYGTRILTTSIHINIGIDDYETLFKLLCALRLDTPLFLALSASSCFHDGKLTDYHSFRWNSFPKTPEFVPFFTNHEEYINWTNEQLASKKMLNVRHLWTSIRPNGPDRPYKLNRIEIRICDFISNANNILAIVAFIESIIQNYLMSEKWPKVLNTNRKNLIELANIINEQEELAAKSSLNAMIWDWRHDSKRKIYQIIESLYTEIEDTAKRLNILRNLSPLFDILQNGNEAIQFLNMYKKNKSISITIQYFIQQFTMMDLAINHLTTNSTR